MRFLFQSFYLCNVAQLREAWQIYIGDIDLALLAYSDWNHHRVIISVTDSQQLLYGCA